MTNKEMPRIKRDELQEELLALVNGGGDAELSAAQHEHILRRKAQKIGRFAVLLCDVFKRSGESEDIERVFGIGRSNRTSTRKYLSTQGHSHTTISPLRLAG